MSTIWDESVLRLEKELEEVKKYQRKTIEAQAQIKIGAIIFDSEIQCEMKVTKLKNGSNDFEAEPLKEADNNGLGRGYSYIGSNWKSVKEI